MAKYLVTGGCGFIGSHLADALVARGDTVIIIDDLSTGKREHAPRAAALYESDIGNASVLETIISEVDGVFHLAAIASVERSNNEWLAAHRTNLTATIGIFEAIRASGRRTPVVYASSAAVYGDNPRIPLSEDALPAPISAYGADKMACELHARTATLVHGIPTIGCRFFNVYGPRQDPSSPYSGVISIFAERMRRNAPLTIHGDGEQTRDFIYVADVVAGMMKAMDSPTPGPEVYNVCTGQATSINTLAETLASLTGYARTPTHTPVRSGDIRHSQGNPARFLSTFDFRAETPLEAGLRQTLTYFL